MSIQIKSLTDGAPVRDDSTEIVTNSSANLIPKANTVYTLYTAPSDKAVIVKSVRLVNILASTVNISLYLTRPDIANPGHVTRRHLAPRVVSIPVLGAYIDDAEITLEPGDKIQATAGTDMAVHYVISGVEREVV